MLHPADVTVDTAGRLWVADYGNHRVLRFDSAAGKPNGASADGVLGQADFSTCKGGTSATTFSVPFHLAFDPSRDMLWVADAFNHRALAFGILPTTTVTPTRTTTSTPTPTTTPSVRPRAYLPIVHSP